MSKRIIQTIAKLAKLGEQAQHSPPPAQHSPPPPISALLSQILKSAADRVTNPTLKHSRDFFNETLSELTHKKFYSTAFSTYRMMISLQVKPNFKTLGFLARCCSEDEKVDFAFVVLGKLFRLRFTPNIITYTDLSKGLVREDRVDEAAVLFGKMSKMGCPPDVYNYQCLVNGLLKHGKVFMAMALTREMTGKGIQPNDAFNASIAKGCLNCGITPEDLLDAKPGKETTQVQGEDLPNTREKWTKVRRQIEDLCKAGEEAETEVMGGE